MTSQSDTFLSSLRARLSKPVGIESLAILRILFGIMMAIGTIRFAASGWIDELFIRPTYFFKYPGFEWMPVWSPTGLKIHFSIVFISAICVAIGFFYRTSLLIFILSFMGVQLFDASNYLNHYYLILCIGMVLLCLPAGAAWSVDARRRPKIRQSTYPIWGLYLLRFQVAAVYFFAAIAKIGSDWLWHAQPLSIWLSARADLPLIGHILAEPHAAYVMSWGGLIYDATIVFFLLWSRTRIIAYIAVILFHALTFILFDIGMFPVIMVVMTTIFFSPKWPTRLPKLSSVIEVREPPKQIRNSALTLIIIWCTFHVLFPFRHLFSGHDVLWAEQGMRYSWRVMVREKMGSVTYLVDRVSDGKTWEVSPNRYLEPRQVSEMSGQPDMIAQLAYFIKDDFERRMKTKVRVRARALVSLNGRPPALMINPNVDLTERWTASTDWLLPRPETPPLTPWGASK